MSSKEYQQEHDSKDSESHEQPPLQTKPQEQSGLSRESHEAKRALAELGFKEIYGGSDRVKNEFNLSEKEALEIDVLKEGEFMISSSDPDEKYGGLKHLKRVIYKNNKGELFVYAAHNLFEQHGNTLIAVAEQKLKALESLEKIPHSQATSFEDHQKHLLEQRTLEDSGFKTVEHSEIKESEFISLYEKALDPGSFQQFYKPADHAKPYNERRTGSILYKTKKGVLFRKTFSDGTVTTDLAKQSIYKLKKDISAIYTREERTEERVAA